MKSFVRSCAALSIVGGAVLGSSWLGNMRALALPQDQILKKLSQVPVFLISDAEGKTPSRCFNPDTKQEVRCDEEKPNANASKQNKVVVIPAFISQQEAQAALEQLRSVKPQESRSLQVVPRSLGFVYQLEQASKSQPSRLVVDYLPIKQQADSALELLRKSGQSVQQYGGVPLFVAVTTVGQDKRYLPGREGNEEVIPLFFDKKQLQGNLDELKKKNPDLASKVEIQVVDLQAFMDALGTSNDPVMSKFVLYPSPDVIKALQGSQPSQQQAPSTPQQRPAQQRPAQQSPRR